MIRMHPNTYRVSRSLVLPIVAATLLTGCSKLVPVEGTVTLDGKPLSGAVINFIPEELKTGGARMADGVTDGSGYFRLETVNDRGASPGKYKVTVSKVVIPREAIPNGVDPAKLTELEIIAINSTPGKEVVPAPYTDPDQTPLRVEVPRRGTRDARIELSTSPSK